MTEPVKSNRDQTGCTVEIREPHKQFKNLEGDSTILELTELFALYLSDYPGAKIIYAGRLLDPGKAITNQFVLPVPAVKLTSGEAAPEGKLRVLEWSHLDRRSLYVCNERGFAIHQVVTRFQVKVRSFSAYLSSPYLNQLDEEGRLELADLDPLAAAVITASKDSIKEHYEAEARREAARIIQEWKTSQIYPYEDEPRNSVEAAERKVF